MVGLSYKDLKERILKGNLIEGYEDLEKQLTPNGIDVRVCAIIEVKEGGEIGLEKKDNKPPKFGRVYMIENKEIQEMLEGYDIEEKVILKKGDKIALKGLQPYLLITCEKVNAHEDLYFKIEIRSTLFRYGQMILETAFGEPEYKGRLTFLLFPTLNTKLALGTRIAQISFMRLSSKASYESQQEYHYQGGKVL